MATYRLNGAVLGALLHSITTARCDFDGFLFGHRTVQQVKRTSDHESEVVVDEELVIVSAVHCNTSDCTFYDAAGDLLPNALQLISKLEAAYQCPTLGWFMARRGSLTHPSMRDLAVLSQMPVVPSSGGQSSSHPPMFAVFGVSESAAGAIDTYLYKFYTRDGATSPVRVTPVDMEITNIGARLQHPSFPASLRPSVLGSRHAGSNERKIGNALANMAQTTSAQTQGVEKMFDCLLDQLHTVAKEVASGLREVEQQREANLALRRNVDRFAAANASPLTVAQLVQETTDVDLNR